ncbi:PadR family transcriptional regulator [soil metagenome]
MVKRERPAEYAILGLLYLNQHGGHGYDLARQFGPGEPLGEILHLEPGMLYHHLKRLERNGWLTSDMAQEGLRPRKQVYRISSDGEAELQRWLQAPVEHTREIRLEFLVKLYFARQLDLKIAETLLQSQRAMLHALLAQLDAPSQTSHQDHSQDDRAFLNSVVALRRIQTGAALEWLNSLDSQ